jgi:hypothetical protein
MSDHGLLFIRLALGEDWCSYFLMKWGISRSPGMKIQAGKVIRLNIPKTTTNAKSAEAMMEDCWCGFYADIRRVSHGSRKCRKCLPCFPQSVEPKPGSKRYSASRLNLKRYVSDTSRLHMKKQPARQPPSDAVGNESARGAPSPQARSSTQTSTLARSRTRLWGECLHHCHSLSRATSGAASADRRRAIAETRFGWDIRW